MPHLNYNRAYSIKRLLPVLATITALASLYEAYPGQKCHPLGYAPGYCVEDLETAKTCQIYVTPMSSGCTDRRDFTIPSGVPDPPLRLS